MTSIAFNELTFVGGGYFMVSYNYYLTYASFPKLTYVVGFVDVTSNLRLVTFLTPSLVTVVDQSGASAAVGFCNNAVNATMSPEAFKAASGLTCTRQPQGPLTYQCQHGPCTSFGEV